VLGGGFVTVGALFSVLLATGVGSPGQRRIPPSAPDRLAGPDRLRQDARRSPSDPELRSLICVAQAALDGVSRPSPAEGGFMVCEYRRLRWAKGCVVPSDDVVEFGGWPRPPRWVWAAAGIAAAAVLAGSVIARTGPYHTAASSPSKPPALAASPFPGWRTPAAGACESTAYLPQIRLAQQHAGSHVRVLVVAQGCGRSASAAPAVDRCGLWCALADAHATI
jgi:hypothetical protein